MEKSKAQLESLVNLNSFLIEVNKEIIEDDLSRLAAIVNSSHDAIIGMTCQGTITSWNPAAEKLYGYSPGEAAGMEASLLFAPEGFQELGQHCSRASRCKEPERFETIHVRKGGGSFPVMVSISPVPAPSGGLAGISLIVRDISAEKEAEESLRRARQEFIAVLSHDLKNPLNSVIGYTRLLEQQLGSEPPGNAHTFVTMIRFSCSILRNLIENIVGASYLKSGKMTFHFTDFPLHTLFSKLSALYEPVVLQSGIALTLQCPEGSMVHGDEERLLQVFMNLIGNAVRHVSAGGRIEVVARREGDHYGIEVHDTGRGIAEEELEAIFKKHGQAKDELTGSGLGLFIVKQFIEKHGSEIKVKSAPGQGAHFFFSLPASQAFTDHERRMP
ncbi:MAG: PAS domain-containing sensor histidine kinase [Candidatus Eremiobacteraeota bacterium]|nr:PAS domain-containing sensor histidine kinase [Candidatus Eremiobacteraeota bacterium]